MGARASFGVTGKEPALPRSLLGIVTVLILAPEMGLPSPHLDVQGRHQ